ncbi:MAG: hypothetical protein IT458_20060 [Planctomycetes bacterium]|nr:hypothetical protein [Planctomycetota bacterium]
MSRPDLKRILEDILEKAGGDWTPEEIELGQRVARDLVELEARALLGEDVDAELAHAKAAALNLAAGRAVTGAKAVSEAVWRYTSELLRWVLPVQRV